MRAVVQRVLHADVTVSGETTGTIEKGLMVLLGVGESDNEKDAEYMAEKVCGLRIFEDADDKMNLSLKDVNGSVLMVSQFTLLGDARHGRRPSFIRAARPEVAEPLFEMLCKKIVDKGIHVETGRFRTHMEVSLVNDGPVTILLDSKKGF